MDKLPFISVVVPVYNVEPYLRRCLDSVITQTYRNLEIILVDDGSTDCSGKICDEYVKKDSRIIIIHKENGGLSDARNVGIKTASADYIAFIDSDDYIEKRCLQRLAWILFKNNADIAICEYYSGNHNEFPKDREPKKKIECFDSKVMLKNWHGKYKHLETIACNKLYKKTLFTENSIYYPVGYFNEDVMTTHLLVEKASKIVITNERLYYYYQRKDSTMHTLSEKKIEDCIFAHNIRLDFFKNKGYQEAYERLVIKRQKLYMLDYLKSMSKEMAYINIEMLCLFNNNNKNICSLKEIKLWERVLFFLFKYFHNFLRIFVWLRKKNYE